MAELDEKTQKHVDRAANKATRAQHKAAMDAVKALGDDAKASDNKEVKAAVVAHHKAVLAAVKDSLVEA